MEVLVRPDLFPDIPAPKAYAICGLAEHVLADERIELLWSEPNGIDLLIGDYYCHAIVNSKSFLAKADFLLPPVNWDV